MRRLVLGIDQGAVTGVAAWGDNGYEFSFQDEERPALIQLLKVLHAYNRQRGEIDVVDAAVEAPFVGKGFGSSLTVAESAGKVTTILWLGGYDRAPWRPMASEWRKLLHFDTRRIEQVDGKAKNVAAKREDLEDQARRHADALTRCKVPFPKSKTHEAEALCIAKAAWLRWEARHAITTNTMREHT